MMDAMFYGLCLDRLRHQAGRAREEIKSKPKHWRGGADRRVVLESYLTGDPAEVADLLDIYDLGEINEETLTDKLEELSETVSILTGEEFEFGKTAEGDFALYLRLTTEAACARL